MNAFELMATIEAIQKAKDSLAEAFTNARTGAADDDFLGALAILADECREFYQLYEKESKKLPKLRGAAW